MGDRSPLSKIVGLEKETLINVFNLYMFLFDYKLKASLQKVVMSKNSKIDIITQTLRIGGLSVFNITH